MEGGGLGAGVCSNSRIFWKSFFQMNSDEPQMNGALLVAYEQLLLFVFTFTFPLTFLFIAFTEDTQVIFGENMRSWEKLLLTALHSYETGAENILKIC